MKNLFYKFFLWIKDHFSLLFTVLFRLHIGGKNKENPNYGSNSAEIEDSENDEKGSYED